MRVIDMADIIRAMQNETQFVLRCEEVFHDKISSAAASILSAQPQKPFVCLTGPSGSGKTTTAMRLKAYLENLGVKVCQISMDNFFLPLDQRPPEATDWESPYCVNRELLLDTVDKLSRGETAQVPWYDFKNSKTGGYTPMEGSREAIIIAEGIHMLNPLLFDPHALSRNGRVCRAAHENHHPRRPHRQARAGACGPAHDPRLSLARPGRSGKPLSARSRSTRARCSTLRRTKRTRPFTSTPSTTMSRAS